MTLYMVIERFRDSDAVYKRFAERGRMLPAGVTYVDSWVEPDRQRCFQLMTAESMIALQQWATNWNDLVDFQFIEVVPSRQITGAAGVAAPELPNATPGFRVARTTDVELILELRRQYCAGEGYPFDEPSARDALSRLIEGQPDRGRVWILEDAGTPVGYVVLTLGYSLEYQGRDAFLDELFIVPEARGRGLGHRATEVVQEACRELGVRALHLEVERGNTQASALYRKQGFADHDRLLMTKLIDGTRA